jgi:flagellar motor protein MotB
VTKPRRPQRTSKAPNKREGPVDVDETSREPALDHGWEADASPPAPPAPARSTIPVQAEWLESDDEAPTRRRSSHPSPPLNRAPRPSPRPRLQKTPPPLPSLSTDHVGDAQRALQRLLALHPARDGEKLLEELQKKLKKVIDAGHAKVMTRQGHVVLKISASALFSGDEANLRAVGAKALAEIASALSYAGGMAGDRLQVAMHAPRAGSAPWKLCAARAMAVAERLAAGGIAASAISVAAFGALDAAAPVETHGIEITVLRGDAPPAVLVENR